MNNNHKELTDADIALMESIGWISLGGWLFFKAGKVYDLSAADLNQLDIIEQKSLFIIAE